jgi:hypothetical protein
MTGTEKYSQHYYENSIDMKGHFKFDYVVGAINDNGEIKYKFRDSIVELFVSS